MHLSLAYSLGVKVSFEVF